MKTSKLMAAVACVVLTACGTAKKDTSDQRTAPAPTTSTQTSTAVDAMPAALVARVPVANGQELNAQVETKELSTKPADAAGVVAAFANASSVKVTDELDKDTSTQSWGRVWHWVTGYGYGGGGYGYGYGGWGGYGYSYGGGGYWWGRRAGCWSWGYNSYGYGYGLTSAPAGVDTSYTNIDAFSKDGYNYYVYSK